jgi:hypothetical protein
MLVLPIWSTGRLIIDGWFDISAIAFRSDKPDLSASDNFRKVVPARLSTVSQPCS